MENLKKLRESKGLTQRDLANEMQIAKTTLCYYEQGKISPSVEMITKLADYFGCSVDYLLGHQSVNILQLDAFTEDQRELIRLIKILEPEQISKLIGYGNALLN